MRVVVTQGQAEGNMELVRRAFDAFARRDLAALVEIMDPEVEFFAPTAAIMNEGRCYRGHPGIARYLHDVSVAWASLEVLPEKFRDVGNHVVVVGKVLARGRDGLEVATPAAWVWQLRSGRLAWGCVYPDPGESFMGIGLEEAEPAPGPPASTSGEASTQPA